MIIRNRPSVLTLFFVLKGSVVQRIWQQVALVGLLSLIVVAAHRAWPNLVRGVDPAPFTLIGISLSIFLSFRNSACYDRWWEARKLWGQIIQTSRDIARQSLPLDIGTGGTSPARKALLGHIIGFAHAMANARGGGIGATLVPDPPDRHLDAASAVIAASLRDGHLQQVEALALNESIVRLSNSLVGCERLSNTPLPFAYTLLLHRTAYLFCFILPFGFADSLGWGTPLGVMLIAYSFFGLDALGEELEEPFGDWPNALPIHAYATVVEIKLRTALGEEPPEMPKAHDYLLT